MPSLVASHAAGLPSPPPIRKVRAASQTDVLSAGDSGCWDSACMRPRFGSRPPVSTPDPPSLRLALPPPPRAARAWGSSSAALPASLQIGVPISHPCLWRDNEPAACTRGSSARRLRAHDHAATTPCDGAPRALSGGEAVLAACVRSGQRQRQASQIMLSC